MFVFFRLANPSIYSSSEFKLEEVHSLTPESYTAPNELQKGKCNEHG